MITMTVSQAPTGGGAVSATRCSLSSHPQPTPSSSSALFSHRRPKFPLRNKRFPTPLTVASADPSGGANGAPATKLAPPPPPPSNDASVSFVGQDSVPLEGVIQFEKPNSFKQLNKWGRIALLSGGDVLALLLFSAIGRFSHGFSVLDTETLRTADPFIAGWFLGAYFLGGYGEDGRGMNGRSNAIIAAAKSWAVGIPVGVVIRGAALGRIPQLSFVLVTMGTTALLLIGWRALLFSTALIEDKNKKNDMYKRGSPFELFELLTSLVRRW